MFQHFLCKYKCDVYVGNTFDWKKTVSWYEWTLMILIMLVFIASPFLFSVSVGGGLLSVGGGMVAICFLPKVTNRRVEKERDSRFNFYKSKKLEPLIEMLKQMDFYCLPKVDWLIQCCDVESNRPKKEQIGLSEAFSKYIFPFLTLLFGIIIKDVDIKTVIVIILIMVLVFSLVCFAKVALIPMYHDWIYPDQYVILYLKSELEYIKTDLTKNNTM